jgi:hypothetical protein
MKIKSIISKTSKSKFRYVVIFSFLGVVGVLSVLLGNFLISNETTEESEASAVVRVGPMAAGDCRWCGNADCMKIRDCGRKDLNFTAGGIDGMACVPNEAGTTCSSVRIDMTKQPQEYGNCSWCGNVCMLKSANTGVCNKGMPGPYDACVPNQSMNGCERVPIAVIHGDPRPPQCVWCGRSCVDRNTHQLACIAIAPPAGKDCVAKGGSCQIVGKGLRCGWCGTRCMDISNTARMDCPLVNWVTPPGECIEQSGSCVEVKNNSPIGAVSSINCNSISGWACDVDDYEADLQIKIFRGNTPSVLLGTVTANLEGDAAIGDRCGGKTAKRFKFDIPESLKDGTVRKFWAQAINVGEEGQNVYLGPSPLELDTKTCMPPDCKWCSGQCTNMNQTPTPVCSNTSIQPCTSKPFTDVEIAEYWCPHFQKLKAEKIIVEAVDSSGIIKPNDSVTRARLALWLGRMKYGGVGIYNPPACTTKPFPDIEISHWACPYIKKLKDDNIIGGYSDGTFRPHEIVNRTTISVLLIKTLYGGSYNPPACTTKPFTDVEINFWACPFIKKMKDDNILTGYPDGTHRSNVSVTRGVAATLLGKAMPDNNIPADMTCIASGQTCVTSKATPIPEPIPKVAISPAEEKFYGNDVEIKLSLSPTTSKYQLYYKIDDSSEKKYSAPFKISKTSTINVTAKYTGANDVTLQKKFTKVSMTKPTELARQCVSDGTELKLEWKKVSNAEAYLVNLYGADSKVELSRLTTKSSTTISGIQMNYAYAKWTVQPLTEESDEANILKSTKHLEATGDGVKCEPPDPTMPVIGRVPSMTNMFKVNVNGTKPAGSAIYIDDKLVIGESPNTNWAYDFNLTKEGENKFRLKTRANNKDSQVYTLTIHRCKFGDLNCDGKINITDFAWFVKAMVLHKTTQEKFEFMELADMNNGEGAKGDGVLDIKDFLKFKDVYIQNVGK